MPRPDEVKELLRCAFTEEELTHKSRELAASVQKQVTAKEEKVAVMADFKERIDREGALVGKLSREINNGWEMREVVVDIFYNRPNIGMKEFVRQDTSECVRTVAMTYTELQDTLPFEKLQAHLDEIARDAANNPQPLTGAEDAAKQDAEKSVADSEAAARDFFFNKDKTPVPLDPTEPEPTEEEEENEEHSDIPDFDDSTEDQSGTDETERPLCGRYHPQLPIDKDNRCVLLYQHEENHVTKNGEYWEHVDEDPHTPNKPSTRKPKK